MGAATSKASNKHGTMALLKEIVSDSREIYRARAMVRSQYKDVVARRQEMERQLKEVTEYKEKLREKQSGLYKVAIDEYEGKKEAVRRIHEQAEAEEARRREQEQAVAAASRKEEENVVGSLPIPPPPLLKFPAKSTAEGGDK